MRRLFLLLALALALSGCLAQADQQQRAQKLVQQLHQAMTQQNWEQMIALYDKRFLEAHPPSAWQAKLEGLFDRYGKLKAIKPTFQQKDPRFGGEFYIFGFLLKFDHGTIRETVTVFKPVDCEQMRITGHLLKPRS